MSYDPKCYEFAEAWLSEERWSNKYTVERLAQEIQDIAEQFTADACELALAAAEGAAIDAKIEERKEGVR